ncbi:hypothetical protein [Bacillus sp. FJAT-18017]|uniref:hypothetical protein n=1 Tax=Bacillus sp. FJAT-18017 TaxID=1705566 RepID=UPI000AA87E89|nr:hypothetical protein [Bacillus sp. FJAT-18017]
MRYKMFSSELEVQGEILTKTIAARTPIDARKTIREEYSADAKILTVKEERKQRA